MSEKPRGYQPIALSDDSTVVAEFVAEVAREVRYKSEAEPEKAFIELLQSPAYA